MVTRYLVFVMQLWMMVGADLCPEPVIPNGRVNGVKEVDTYFGEISCDSGFHLVGTSKKIKCRQGRWSYTELPVCTAIGVCPYLPELHNGRNIPIQGSRHSAFRFKCNRGYKRYGELRTHCIGDKWSHKQMPVCTKATCDESGMLDIPYGEGKSMMRGAVYKYRCNPGIKMEGSDTVVCTGDSWNGTVPNCNVEPTEPSLEVIVSGQAVNTVMVGDYVLVNCQPRGGHPLPDVSISMDGFQEHTSVGRKDQTSFSFTATEDDDGKIILCSAFNKVGDSSSSTLLHVEGAPKEAKITGPVEVEHEAEFTYDCKVFGGNPEPMVYWTIVDHIGHERHLNGKIIAPGVSQLKLTTGTEERAFSVGCVAENKHGRAERTLQVHTNYSPSEVKIAGQQTATPGEYIHLTCTTSETFPAPNLRWKINLFGEVQEVQDIDADVQIENVYEGGIIGHAKIDVHVPDNVNKIIAHCSSSSENMEMINSEEHEIKVMKLANDDISNLISEAENVIDPEYDIDPSGKSIDQIEETDTNVSKSNFDNFIPFYQNLEIEEVIEPENEKEKFNKSESETSQSDEDVYRRSEFIPENPTLKHEKVPQPQTVQSPVPRAFTYSSSSLITSPSIILLLMKTILHY